MDFKISRRRHIIHAAVIWILIGLLLCWRGLNWTLIDVHTSHWSVVIIPAAMILGVLKGIFLLRKSASKVVYRIQEFAEQTPFWQIFSPATYILILGMMAFGIACRWAGARWHFKGDVGVLYLVVGIALITGSSRYWSFLRAPASSR